MQQNNPNNKIKVSIIIPCFNQAQYLPDTLNSILNQTFSEWECIIINDGSSDKTDEIGLEWADLDSRFKYLKTENNGLSIARNIGIHFARGEYVGFIDSDDWIDTEYLQKLYQMANDQGADIAMGNLKCHYSDRARNSDISWVEKIINSINTNTIIRISDRKKIIFTYSVCNKLFLRSFLDKNNFLFYENLYWEDNPFTIITTIKANKICLLRDTYYNYRIHKRGISGTASIDRKPFDIFEVMKKLRLFFDNEKVDLIPEYNHFYDELLFTFYYSLLTNRIHRKYRKEFFYRLKNEFSKLNQESTDFLKKKFRMFYIIYRSNYTLFLFVYTIKSLYTRLS